MGYTGEQKRNYQREWLAQRRRRAIQFLGGACVQCGSQDDLEIDHREAHGTIGGKLWSRAWWRIEDELEKCQLLCHDCHVAKSATEKATGVNHGQSILNPEIVREIRLRVANGERQIKLARELKLDRRTVWDVVHRKSWKWID